MVKKELHQFRVNEGIFRIYQVVGRILAINSHQEMAIQHYIWSTSNGKGVNIVGMEDLENASYHIVSVYMQVPSNGFNV